ncbi:hypothetical protein [Mycoplasma phocimorsus]|nr:hypothetical protein [Mycoplasma phocimorsus]MDJ1647706.1 hypothetical protein [Mycoplasma phocimorsus]
MLIDASIVRAIDVTTSKNGIAKNQKTHEFKKFFDAFIFPVFPY